MTQQVCEVATPAQVLAKVAELCTDGLPVPVSTQVSAGPCGVWLTLHMADDGEVDAWASRLGLVPDVDAHVHTTPRRWQSYHVHVWDGDAEACWSPGVTYVKVWSAMDHDEVERWCGL